MARYPEALWTPAKAINYSTTLIQHKWIYLHVTQGTFDGTIAWFQQDHPTPPGPTSSHFLVGKDGRVAQFMDTNECAYAEEFYNNLGISIENEGFTGEHLTLAQTQAAARLLVWINEIHRISAQAHG